MYTSRTEIKVEESAKLYFYQILVKYPSQKKKKKKLKISEEPHRMGQRCDMPQMTTHPLRGAAYKAILSIKIYEICGLIA